MIKILHCWSNSKARSSEHPTVDLRDLGLTYDDVRPGDQVRLKIAYGREGGWATVTGNVITNHRVYLEFGWPDELAPALMGLGMGSIESPFYLVFETTSLEVVR